MQFKLGLEAALLALPLTLAAQNNLGALPLANQAATLAPNKPNLNTPSGNVPALYQQALNAIEKGQFDLAEHLLHAVVQQNPDLPGAWLDLALLAARQENFAQAEEFLIVLEDRFSPLPSVIQEAVNQLKRQLAVHLKLAQSAGLNGAEEINAGWQHQTAVSLSAGYDNNVNAGIRFSTITLTLPDRNLELSVLSSNMPVAASFVRAGLVHQVKAPITDGALTFQVQMQSRSYHALPQYANQEFVPQVSLEHKSLPGVLTVGVQGVALNHALAYRTPIVRWQVEQAAPQRASDWGFNCKLQQQLQVEQRHYLISTHLDSRWWGLKPAVLCENVVGRTGLYVQRSQEDAATSLRPGGNTRQMLWGLSQVWLAPFGLEGHSLQGKLEWQNSKDSEGYSYLLENGAARRLQNRQSHVSWHAPIADSRTWRWSLGVQNNVQQSNIALFKQRSFSLESSIWRAW